MTPKKDNEKREEKRKGGTGKRKMRKRGCRLSSGRGREEGRQGKRPEANQGRHGAGGGRRIGVYVIKLKQEV